MKWVVRTIFLWLIVVESVLNTNAQTGFNEGILLYKADTLERLVPNPGEYRIVQMKIYKKAGLARQEVVSVNSSNLSDTVRITQIRNEKGIYILLSSNLNSEKMAVLSTYEEEKQEKADRASKGYLPTYSVEKTGQKAQLLGLTTEKVLVKEDTTKPLEALVCTTIEAPVALFFETLSQVKGTPLQFQEKENGWLIRYTATAIVPGVLPAQLFDVDPGFTVLSMKQVKEMGNVNK